MPDEFSARDAGSTVQSCPYAKEKAKHWIEIELLGENDEPVPGEEYLVTLGDGTQVSGYLDNEGWVRIDNIEPAANCTVSFPRLDLEACKKHTNSPLEAKAGAKTASAS